MMFEITMDNEIPGWYLGEVECKTAPIDCRIFTCGLPQEPPGPLSVRVKYEGDPLDCTFSDFFVPIVKRRLADVFERFAPDAVQRFPVDVEGITERYEVLNVIRLVDAVDRERSRYRLWQPGDHRADLVGRLRAIDHMVLRRDLPPNLHTFRIADWDVVWVVSPALKAALEEVGCRGAIFRPIEQ